MTLRLLSEQAMTQLLSLSLTKKSAFLLLMYERMLPELYKFCQLERRDASVYEGARQQFWMALTPLATSISWSNVRNDILDATPDSEEFGSLLALYALNAALVAADLAGLHADRQDQHVIEAISYAFASLDCRIQADASLPIAASLSISSSPMGHLFLGDRRVQRETVVEEEDIRFLSNMQEFPWLDEQYAGLRLRAESQLGLLV